VLGPDIIDPRQMELIRQNAQRAAQGQPYGVRELPPAAVEVVEKARAKAQAARPVAIAQSAGPASAGDAELAAARLARRQEALARKRAQLKG
jgi:hypothetical protein